MADGQPDSMTFDIVDPRSHDAVWAMTQYFEELDRRFPAGFEPGDALAVDADKLSPPGGVFVVAHTDGRAVACGGVQTIGDGVGEIKRMWVDGSCRGLGLGRRLLGELEERSRALGHGVVRLDTNSVLTEAVAMYRGAGYVEIGRYSDNPHPDLWFEKPLRPPTS